MDKIHLFNYEILEIFAFEDHPLKGMEYKLFTKKQEL